MRLITFFILICVLQYSNLAENKDSLTVDNSEKCEKWVNYENPAMLLDTSSYDLFLIPQNLGLDSSGIRFELRGFKDSIKRELNGL